MQVYITASILMHVVMSAISSNEQDWAAVAACRAQCFKRYVFWPVSDEKCAKNEFCFQCWHDCQTIYDMTDFKITGQCPIEKCQDEVCALVCDAFLSQSHHVKSTGWSFTSPPAVSVQSDQLLKVTWQRPLPITDHVPPEDSDTPVVYIILIKTKRNHLWRKVSMTTNEQTMVEVDHSNIPDLSFLLLAVTVDGIVGQSAPFYSEQRSHDKSKESEIPLVWSDDSDYYYYGESDEADSADNDFSLLFGRPPPAPSTIKPTTTINHFFTYSSASTDRVGSTSVPGRSATDNYHRNLQNARVQYTTSGRHKSGPSKHDLVIAIVISSASSFVVALSFTLLLLLCRARCTRNNYSVCNHVVPELAVAGLVNNRLYTSADRSPRGFVSATHTALPPVPHHYATVNSAEYTLPDTPAWSLDHLTEATNYQQYSNYRVFQGAEAESLSTPPDNRLPPVPPRPMGCIPGPLMAARRSYSLQEQQRTVSPSTCQPLYATIQPRVRMGTANIRKQYCQIPTADSYEILPDSQPQETSDSDC